MVTDEGTLLHVDLLENICDSFSHDDAVEQYCDSMVSLPNEICFVGVQSVIGLLERTSIDGDQSQTRYVNFGTRE